MFAPKYRRKVFYKEKRAAIGKILRQLCKWKSVKIIEAEACPDHIHLFVEIPPKLSISGFMGYLKGKSSTMLYEQFGELKYKYRNREFWCRGVLCGYGRKERDPNCGVYKEPTKASINKSTHVGQPVFSVLFALLSLAGDSPPASKRTKIPRKSKAVRCEAVLPEQKCSQTRKRPQRILCVFSRALTQYEGISAQQNRVCPCQSTQRGRIR